MNTARLAAQVVDRLMVALRNEEADELAERNDASNHAKSFISSANVRHLRVAIGALRQVREG